MIADKLNMNFPVMFNGNARKFPLPVPHFFLMELDRYMDFASFWSLLMVDVLSWVLPSRQPQFGGARGNGATAQLRNINPLPHHPVPEGWKRS